MHKKQGFALPRGMAAGKRLTSIRRELRNGGNRGRKAKKFGRNPIRTPAKKETIHG